MSEQQLTYLVTGASRGLGLEFVKQLSAKGHIVIATAREPTKSEQLVSLIDNEKVIGIALDTTDLSSVKAAFEKIKTVAPHGVDVLINNSGVCGSRDGTTLTATPDQYLDVFETNVVGTSNVAQATLPLLRQKETRKIINISSVSGSIEINAHGGGMPYYGVSKAAENYLTKALSASLLEEKFIVVAIHPGWVQTDMGGKDAHLKAEESISGMVEQIEKVTQEKSGSFFDYTGKPVPY